MPVADRVRSPCAARCGLNASRRCVGCGRTLEEIVFWHDYSSDEQREIVAVAAQRKAELTDTEVVSAITLVLAQELRARKKRVQQRQ